MSRFRYAANVLAGALRNVHHTTLGRCPVCGHATAFVLVDSSDPREAIMCARCRCSARNRLVALEMLDRLGGRSLRGLSASGGLSADVYVAAAGGPIFQGLRVGMGRLSTSDYVPDVPLGALLPDGHSTCQDLQTLTFDDDSFDVVVTEDVLEHVRDPEACFREIARVLRPGGVHIFTAPMRLDQPLETRVDTSGPEDIELMEPEWHGDSIRGRILSYRTFGYDLFDQLEKYGFTTRVRLPRLFDKRAGVFDAFAVVSTKT